MFKKILLLFIFTISFSIEIDYNGIDVKLKSTVDNIVNTYTKSKINNIANLSNNYISPNTLGENILLEIDYLKSIIEISSNFNILGENKNVTVSPSMGVNAKFLEKGNDLDLKLNINYGYDINEKSDIFSINGYTDFVYRKTNTMLSANVNYDYIKKLNTHNLGGYVRLSNQFNVKNSFISEIGISYLYNYKIPSTYINNHKIEYRTNKDFFTNGINANLKLGYKHSNQNTLYTYLGFDYTYFFNNNLIVTFDKKYDIVVEKDKENMFFVPNIGVIYTFSNNHTIKLNIASILSLKKYDRYKISLEYTYKKDIDEFKQK